MTKKYTKREYYIKKLEPFIDKNIIKVIVGQRRVGKSYLLFQLIDIIKQKYKTANIIYVNKELNEFDWIKNYNDLLKYINENIKKSKKNYIFIDEIQDIENFEKALRSLNAEEKYDIYCTGSNANLFSGELATYLSGRYIEVKVFSLSYKEFLLFHKLENNKDTFLKFLRFGGLPYLVNLELTDEIVFDYLKNVYNTILLKDVVARHNIRNVNFLNSLAEYLADNTGSIVSAKKISDFLKSQKINISTNIVLDYLAFLQQAFFILKTPRSVVQGKKIFEIGDKYYFEDIGLRHSLIGFKQVDISKILENIVFLHLVTNGYKVTIGQLGKKEIDFICEKQGELMYVQVAYLITDENKEREFGNLLLISDNYPKIVVSMDEVILESNYKGIKHLNIREFLVKKKTLLHGQSNAS